MIYLEYEDGSIESISGSKCISSVLESFKPGLKATYEIPNIDKFVRDNFEIIKPLIKKRYLNNIQTTTKEVK